MIVWPAFCCISAIVGFGAGGGGAGVVSTGGGGGAVVVATAVVSGVFGGGACSLSPHADVTKPKTTRPMMLLLRMRISSKENCRARESPVICPASSVTRVTNTHGKNRGRRNP